MTGLAALIPVVGIVAGCMALHVNRASYYSPCPQASSSDAALGSLAFASEHRCHRPGGADSFKSDARPSTLSPEIVLIQTSTSSALGPPLRLPVGDG